jgi:hypothetical protein
MLEPALTAGYFLADRDLPSSLLPAAVFPRLLLKTRK